MQYDSKDSSFPLSSSPRSNYLDLQQTKLTNTLKNNRTHVRKELILPMGKETIDEATTANDSKLAQRLVAFGGSG